MTLACPIPLDRYPVVTMAHGGGGRLMRTLIDEMFVARFGSDALQAGADSADLGRLDGRVAFTTDTFVVRPRTFPGGDIGRLSVFGTVNDLAMVGARPVALSLALVIEEGFRMQELWALTCSVADAAAEARVPVVTGDTKVVERGAADGVFVNTSGVGRVPEGRHVGPSRIRPGDAVLASGDLGRHGIAVLAARGELGIRVDVESDCAPLSRQVEAVFDAAVGVGALRDATRGGAAAALHELASASGHTIVLEQDAIRVHPGVRAACEVLGLDPLHVACEGRFVATVDGAEADMAIEALRRAGGDPGIIGTVVERATAPLEMNGRFGTRTVLDLPAGAQLPRIC